MFRSLTLESRSACPHDLPRLASIFGDHRFGASPSTETVTAGAGVMTIEVGPDVVLRVPCEVAMGWAAALVRARRGAA